MSQATQNAVENRVGLVLLQAFLLFFDRFIHRFLPFSIIGLGIILFWPQSRSTMVAVAFIGASLWAIADLARGIEIDAENKDHTLRDRVLMTWKETNND